MHVPQTGTMSASKSIHCFSSQPAAFGFLVSLPPGNITLNIANRRNDHSLLDFQTGIGAAAHATLYTEQLIYHTRTVLVDTIVSLQHSDGGVIIASEVHEPLSSIHDILDNVVSKWGGNIAHIIILYIIIIYYIHIIYNIDILYILYYYILLYIKYIIHYYIACLYVCLQAMS